MECEHQITFSIYSDQKNSLFELSEYDTVGKLFNATNWEEHLVKFDHFKDA